MEAALTRHRWYTSDARRALVYGVIVQQRSNYHHRIQICLRPGSAGVDMRLGDASGTGVRRGHQRARRGMLRQNQAEGPVDLATPSPPCAGLKACMTLDASPPAPRTSSALSSQGHMQCSRIRRRRRSRCDAVRCSAQELVCGHCLPTLCQVAVPCSVLMHQQCTAKQTR